MKIEAFILRPGAPSLGLLNNSGTKRQLCVVGSPTENSTEQGLVRPMRNYRGRAGIAVDHALIEGSLLRVERGADGWGIPLEHVDAIRYETSAGADARAKAEALEAAAEAAEREAEALAAKASADEASRLSREADARAKAVRR